MTIYTEIYLSVTRDHYIGFCSVLHISQIAHWKTCAESKICIAHYKGIHFRSCHLPGL